MGKTNKKALHTVPSAETPPLNGEQARIAEWLNKVRFKKKLFGVSELDVWKKLDELNRMYQAALAAERVRYDVLLEQKNAGSAPESGDPGGV